MATHKSTQRTNLTSTPIKRLDSTDHNDRRTLFFEFTVPAGNAAANDLVELVEIPANVRLLGGKIAAEAMSSGGGDASIQIGDGTTADRFLGTTSVDAAADFEFGKTFAKGYGDLISTKFTLTAKVITEAWLAGKKLRGEITYLQGVLKS